ncbi:hypothetical protein VTK73DRAFT_1179 [Phialemonium thermophilum]|uniref:Uncharacterized protein n=1 Tax=Phialemonium thermophilum TaxID=223376 RepID=A0ABR3VTX7_9PEZI
MAQVASGRTAESHQDGYCRVGSLTPTTIGLLRLVKLGPVPVRGDHGEWAFAYCIRRDLQTSALLAAVPPVG